MVIRAEALPKLRTWQAQIGAAPTQLHRKLLGLCWEHHKRLPVGS